MIGFADRCLSTWLPRDLVETWRIELQSCNRPFVGFGAVDTSRVPTDEDGRTCSLLPRSGTCDFLSRKQALFPSELHPQCGSPDGSYTRFSVTENHSDLSIRPRG